MMLKAAPVLALVSVGALLGAPQLGRADADRPANSDENAGENSTAELAPTPAIGRAADRLAPTADEPDEGYGFDNPQSTRYFFAPNALGLESGTGYYQNAWIFFNNVNYGVTDNFSIGAGTIPMFLSGVPEASPAWILPKVSVSASDRVHFALGGMFGGMLAGNDSIGAGLAYGLVTIGDRDNNATLGAGYGYAAGSVGRTPTFNMSGMARASDRLFLVTENYYFPWADSGLISAGIRLASEGAAVDLGAVSFTQRGELSPALPWLGVSIPFGG